MPPLYTDLSTSVHLPSSLPPSSSSSITKCAPNAPNAPKCPSDLSPSLRSAAYLKSLHLCNQLIYSPSVSPLTVEEILEKSRGQELSYDAFLSLLKNVQTEHVKQTTGLVRSQMTHHFALYRSGKSIIEISSTLNFPPYLLAKQMLENIFPSPRSRVSTILKSLPFDPTLSFFSSSPLFSPRPGDFLSPLGPFPLPHFFLSLAGAVHRDPLNGPLPDRYRRSLGQSYELLLQSSLPTPYLPESSLRLSGFSKTPDILLLTPIKLSVTPRSSINILWLDSKAMYGSPEVHARNLTQARGYVNRFGPGVIVYWFGHCVEGEEDVGVVDGVGEITTITQSITQLTIN
ncbi:hypothetical protein TrVE_jg9235 [Triparma verrucosa]|uniref:CDAN1-interacting nuclease 1 n=1 Tax=Triparma verrucosa TaxID=1606542 RepID=A0A9W7ET13_9STRA|nr:hypothetical protein TrVE_jg9235 [Triparma verrucosa]